MNVYEEEPRPLVLNKSMNDEGRDSFAYSYRDNNSSQDFLKDLSVNWQTFSNEVLALNQNNPVPLDRLALKFIHRYNENTKRWYVTVQLCEIYGSPLPDTDYARRHESYLLISRDTYFTINDDGTISEDGDTGLGGATEAKYGINYFDNIYYGMNKVVVGKNVQSITFSWFVLQKLHADNCNPNRPDDSLFSIVFSSSSYRAALPSKNTFVEYPHCVTAYMSYDGIDCLDLDTITLGKFGNKAANFNTLCPKRCGIFLWNADLQRPAVQLL